MYRERYLRGEYAQVWDELIALGSYVREKAIYPDAWAVARETMHRVRFNVDDILIPRLSEIGYEFGYGWLEPKYAEFGRTQGPVRTPPPPNILRLLDSFEQKMGPIPLSIRAFYQEVGGVNLSGFLPRRPLVTMPDGTSCPLFQAAIAGRDCQGPDPFYVYGPQGQDFFDAVIELNKNDDPESDGPLADGLPIAPDSCHKINVSGNGGYTIHIPDAAADAKLDDEWHHTTFVNYLRICCACNGLPGLEGLSFLSEEERAYVWKDQLPF